MTKKSSGRKPYRPHQPRLRKLPPSIALSQIWAAAYADPYSGTLRDDKALGSDFIDEVLNILRKAGMPPPEGNLVDVEFATDGEADGSGSDHPATEQPG